MTPVATTFFFYFLSAIAVVSALLVITRRNPIHSALALIFTLLSVGGLYLMLYAPFVFGVQIILYAGGIVVLFLFVIMLINLEVVQKEEQLNRMWVPGVAAAAGLFGLLIFVFVRGRAVFPQTFQKLPEESNTQQIGEWLYSFAPNTPHPTYILPFEIASLLLLVAIVGAVVMAKKRIS